MVEFTMDALSGGLTIPSGSIDVSGTTNQASAELIESGVVKASSVDSVIKSGTGGGVNVGPNSGSDPDVGGDVIATRKDSSGSVDGSSGLQNTSASSTASSSSSSSSSSPPDDPGHTDRITSIVNQVGLSKEQATVGAVAAVAIAVALGVV